MLVGDGTVHLKEKNQKPKSIGEGERWLIRRLRYEAAVDRSSSNPNATEEKKYIYIKIKSPRTGSQQTDQRHGSWTRVGNREDLGVKAVGKMCNTTGR
jgi:hypothetical protein